MKKKLALISVAIAALTVFTACSASKPIDVNTFIIREGVSLTREMGGLAQNSEYIAFMSPTDAWKDTIRHIGEKDYQIPEKAYIIGMPEDLLLNALRASMSDREISEEIIGILGRKINASTFANIINASQGAELLAATSLLLWGKSYVQPDGWTENRLLVLEYAGDFSSLISFTKSGDGVISASAVFVTNGDGYAINSLESFLNLITTDVTTISGDELQQILTA